MDKNTRNLLVLAGLAVAGGYFLLEKVRKSLGSIGEAIGSGLYDLFHPDPVGETLFYTVLFPDGQHHAVPSKSVSASGRFTREGITYQLFVDKGKPTGVNKYAVKV